MDSKATRAFVKAAETITSYILDEHGRGVQGGGLSADREEVSILQSQSEQI
jgi:hypothetical protein